jgi:hypothetical protein
VSVVSDADGFVVQANDAGVGESDAKDPRLAPERIWDDEIRALSPQQMRHHGRKQACPSAADHHHHDKQGFA